MKRASVAAVAVITFALVLVVLGCWLPVYWVYLLSAVAISALIARSVGLVTVQIGVVTLCQMSFAAIGGWVVSWIALQQWGLPFPLLILMGGISAGVFGALVGLATLRLRGVEFAVVTLGFAAALDLILRQGSFPGVGSGTPVIPEAPFDDPRGYFALVWTVLGLALIGIGAFSRTAHGLSWKALRGSERAAAALGVRIGPARMSGFALGALTAGLAGGLLAGQYGLLTLQIFSPLTSMVYLATAVLCGASLYSGAILAGVVSVFIPELLRRIGLPLDVSHGLLALAAFDVLRRGNGGLMQQLTSKLQDRAFRGERTTCTLLPLRRDREDHVVGQEANLDIAGLAVALGGPPILDAVDLSLRRGEVHALIGPNGAGKTTLIDAVTGFLPTYDGAISIEGRRIDSLTVHQRVRVGIRRTFQQPRGIEAMTVDEYLKLAVDRNRPDLRQMVREFFGLPSGNVPLRLMDVASRRILELAAALVSQPLVLLIDEPAAGLEETESLELAERVRLLPEVFGCAVLLIEHDMSFVRAASHRVTVLSEGRVISVGEVSAVLDAPDVIAAYLGTDGAQ